MRRSPPRGPTLKPGRLRSGARETSWKWIPKENMRALSGFQPATRFSKALQKLRFWSAKSTPRAIFSVDISAREDLSPQASDPADSRYPIDAGVFGHGSLDACHRFIDLRSAMCLLESFDAEAAAVSRALSSWHRSHSFCSACGKPSTPAAAGWQRRCASCQRIHFPRTDPVVIMLVTRGNSLLIGRSPEWPQRMYSLLAGYMEPGETIERAVRRESCEEAGVHVGRVRYLASQPWPFPASLMIGCWGEALTSEITVDPAELADARWISREELVLVFDGQSGAISPPRPGSIAQFLMLQWLSGQV